MSIKAASQLVNLIVLKVLSSKSRYGYINGELLILIQAYSIIIDILREFFKLLYYTTDIYKEIPLYR